MRSLPVKESHDAPALTIKNVGGARKYTLYLVLIYLLALIVRLVSLMKLWALPESFILNADSLDYHQMSLAVAGMGNPIHFPQVFTLSPFTIYFGAASHLLLGNSVFSVIVPQVLLVSFTPVLLALVGKELAMPLAGLWAGVLYCVAWPVVIYDVALLSTPFAVLLSTASCYTAIRAADHLTLPRVIIAGIVCGVSISCRPNFMLFAPLLLGFFFVRLRTARRQYLGYIAALFTAIMLPIAPIFVHNIMHGGEPILLTHTAGINLFIGNNQGANGRLKPTFGAQNASAQTEAFRNKAQNFLNHPLSLRENSNFWIAQTGRETANDIPRFFINMGRKIIYGINKYETPDTISPEFLKHVLPFYRLPFPNFAVLLSFGIVGLAIMSRPLKGRILFLWGALLVPFLTMLIFFVTSRYRAPMIPILCLGAAHWMGVMAQQVRKREFKTMMPLLFATVIVFVLSSLPVLHSNYSTEMDRLRTSLSNQMVSSPKPN